MKQETDLKLVYVLKIGYHANGKGLYEFIFSKDPSSINATKWRWDVMPAAGNAQAPDEEHIDTILSLKTDKIDFVCLHELNDRTYLDGYYTIHALAYQNLEYENTDLMYEELPILVFHYGMKLKEVEDALYSRDLIFKREEVTKSVAAKSYLNEVGEDEDSDDELIA